MRSFKKNRWFFVLLVLAVVLGSQACVTPEAVRQFTGAATAASRQVRPLLRDLTASCIRKHLADRPLDEIADTSDEAEKACKEFSRLVPNLLGALDVLINYLSALNQLASNEVVSYDKQIDGLAAQVQAAGRFGDGPTTAMKGLARFLFDTAASGYQRKGLGSAIKAADGDVATLTNALSTIAGEDYSRELAVEQQSVLERFRQAVQADKSKNPTTLLLLQDRWRENLENFENKRRAIRDFQELLGKIRDGHHQLAAQVDHWTAKELRQTLSPYTVSIRQLIRGFQPGF